MHFTFVESTKNTYLGSKYPQKGFLRYNPLENLQICVDRWWGLVQVTYDTIKSNNIVGF
jgi:hypothetical protein